jgi:hypothetical protein
VPVKLPFKIDCRDLSRWLGKQNPFSPDNPNELPANWQKSLESFLAAQVTHHSGGAAFSIADLHAVVRISPILLVFDGLDEVADITRRREVVDEITRGTNRLEGIAAGVQAIVTSRPAAFANSPGLPEETYTYFSLASITQPLIEQYADKWLKARRLMGKEASDVRRILRNKLDQPHLRELARNPMQLAILLSLIHTRGGSLPDKRTALYDSYVELAFSREAEKSAVVREHRDLLLDIHRYLAWVLHSEAQTERNSGSVSDERLRQLVKAYLIAEQYDPSLADALFGGMIERVVALVSRVEGTYEFEVQPLREYFAARYLYETAPYSPPGNERRGTKPDRFDALSRDFFWQNVTRFYAGCFSKGELASLVERLQVLSRAAGYANTSHPQMLAATLLSDWVFAQHPRSMKQVVALILGGIGLRCVTAGARRYHRDEPLILPKQSGNEELVDRCFELLSTHPARDYARMLIDLIRPNASPEEITARWLTSVTSASGKDRTRRIVYGMHLGALSKLPAPQVATLLEDDCDYPERLTLLLRGGRSEFIEADENRFGTVIAHLLNHNPDTGVRRSHSLTDVFFQVLSPLRYSCAFENRHPMPLSTLWEHVYRPLDIGNALPSLEARPPWELAQHCVDVIECAHDLWNVAAAKWAAEIGPWNELLEVARRYFGDAWLLRVFANTSAGIRSSEERCDDASDLLDIRIPLCRRARHARLKASATSWWHSQLEAATGREDTSFTLLVLLTWAGASVLQKHAAFIDDHLRSLEPDVWERLSYALQQAGYALGQERRDVSLDVSALPPTLSERAVVTLASRVSIHVSDHLFQKYLHEYGGNDVTVLAFCQSMALRAAEKDSETWRSWLPIISRSYEKGAVSDRYFGYRFARAARGADMPEAIAEEIVQHCETYPTELVAWAELTCRQKVAERIIPVGTVAVTERWFETQ